MARDSLVRGSSDQDGMAQGTLFLVIGPSGAGKDSVINGARRRFAQDGRFSFPRRIITRPAGAGGEVYQAVTPAQFDMLRREGAFFLYWGSHGINYALPISIEEDLQAGRSVVVNVSRAAIPEAHRRVRKVVVVEITAPAAALTERLVRRGRETPAEIGERMNHAAAYHCDEAITILNKGSLNAAVDEFCTLLTRQAGLKPSLGRRLHVREPLSPYL